MGNLTLNGATSGQITLAPPSVAGTNTISLPAQTATVLTDSSAAMNIGSGQIYKDASGNVGIGTSSPSYKLQVKGSSGAQSYLSIHDGTGDTTVSGNNAASLLFQARDTSIRTIAEIDAVNTTTNGTGGAMVFQTRISDTLSERARIDSSGNLLVGTASPINSSRRLQVLAPSGGTASAFQTQNNGNAGCEFYNQSGSLVGNIVINSGTTAYNTSSDYRLKENVNPMTTGLAKISALKPVTYDWISDKSEGEGFIAHELQSVIPLAVTGEKDAVDVDGNPIHQGVDYSKIVVHLVAAMQEQQSIIEDLKARLAVLEAK